MFPREWQGSYSNEMKSDSPNAGETWGLTPVKRWPKALARVKIKTILVATPLMSDLGDAKFSPVYDVLTESGAVPVDAQAMCTAIIPRCFHR